jgi:hypothetical protein
MKFSSLLALLFSFLIFSPLRAEEQSTPKSKEETKQANTKEEKKENKDKSCETPKREEKAENGSSNKDAKKEDDKDNDDKEKNNGDKKDEEKVKEEPPKIGNFSLPISQQPAALFGFGGNIIDQGEIQWYFFADEFVGKKRFVMDLIPSVLFGITNDLSIFFNAPFTPLMRDGDDRSSGLEDFFVQLEYAFYNYSNYLYSDQATIVTNVTVPTGSIHKNPPTGFGSPSFFIGATYYHMLVDWFLFTSHGAILTTSDHRTKFGDQFLYQFGFGKNIPSPPGLIYAWMIEVDGQYNQKNRFRGEIDPNSGGNFIYVTPSLWVSSKQLLVQFGISFPITQNLFGDQRKVDYGLNFNIAWSFY